MSKGESKYWADLKEESAVWISDVNFWSERMDAYQIILDDGVKSNPNKDKLKTIGHLQNIVTYYSHEFLLDLKSRIFHHQEATISMENKSKDITTPFIEQHDELKKQMDLTENTLRTYANEFREFEQNITPKIKSPNPIKKILIPTDFSLNANRAVDYALNLLGHLTEEIIILNVLASPYKAAELDQDTFENVHPNGLDELKAEEKRLQKSFPAIKGRVRFVHEVGFLIDKIMDVASKNDVDLIVMGTKGSSGISSVLFGTHTTHLIKHSRLPLLVVPNEAPLLPLDNILLALDLELDAVPERFEIFEAIRKIFKSKLNIIHVESDETKLSSVFDKMQENNVLELLGLEGETIEHFTANDVKSFINSEVAKRSIDLVCLMRHHNGWLYNALGRSVTASMVMDTHVPLLIFHQ
ncbi:MAG: nucleotide-binding universal stress UspA family protein [Parvicellaceae bacterium]